ncbi:MAG: DoxX family protein [Sphingomonadales bacterium]|nr:DoxX family protein [Sphingomonadales bacterium]
MNSDPFGTARFARAAHALLRIMAALSFISHGTMKLLHFPTMPAMPGGPPPMPSPPLLSLFGVAGMFEIVGGSLVLLGLFTRPVALLLSGEMAVAFWLVHARAGIIPATNMGEAAYLYCFLFLWLATAGAGPWSLDERRSA